MKTEVEKIKRYRGGCVTRSATAAAAAAAKAAICQGTNESVLLESIGRTAAPAGGRNCGEGTTASSEQLALNFSIAASAKFSAATTDMKAVVAVPAVALLMLRAWSNNSLTPLGLAFALVVAIIHALHPWPTFFGIIVVFFLGGTATTKVKHHEKSKITHSSTGDAGGEGPRNHIQVLANSLVSSVLILLHYFQLRRRAEEGGPDQLWCYAWGEKSDLLVVGIIAQYAAAAADTWASELGILSKSPPRLITSPTLRVVPPGTNGGVTLVGTLASMAGSLTIALTALALLPFCQAGGEKLAGTKLTFGGTSPGLLGGHGWSFSEYCIFVAAITLWGALGSLLDSFLGATFQNTVVDTKTGRVIEGRNGQKVLVHAPSEKERLVGGAPSRKIVTGSGLLDNNGVNFLTSLTMAVAGMATVGFFWGIPLHSILA